MTKEEVEQNLGKIVKMKAEGMNKGWKYIRITDHEANEKTPWGTGTILTEDPFSNKKRKVRYALSQVELIYNSGRKRKANGNGNGNEDENRNKRKRKKNNETKKEKE